MSRVPSAICTPIIRKGLAALGARPQGGRGGDPVRNRMFGSYLCFWEKGRNHFAEFVTFAGKALTG